MYFSFNPSIALASWVQLSPEELVAQSKLSVVGEFIGTTRVATQESGKELIVGIIKIQKVLSGSIRDDFLLIAIRKADVPQISSTIRFKKGQKGLWLLTRYSADNKTLYSASHPQQFTQSTDKETIKHLINLVTKHKRHD